MQNPVLKQRGNRTRPANRSSNEFKPSKSRKSSDANNKTRSSSHAWALTILGIIVLGGLFYVDTLTHDGLSRKAHNKGNNDKETTFQSAQEAALVSAESDEAYELLLGEDGRMYHVIFSTDCSTFQHWQSYLMFHSALKVKQPGTVTRIASGCTDEDAIAAQKWHKEHITDVMGTQFILHLTPHFSGVKDKDGKIVGDYKFFNKPFGLKYWLEHGIGFEDEESKLLKREDDVVILIDPDMVLLRPITGDFSNDRDVVLGKRNAENRKLKVEQGQPFAQKYGMGTQWRTFNLKEIAGPDSPAIKVDQRDGGTYYPAGPPYIGTVRDMYAISEKWTEFVPKVHKEYPYLLAEMYAFCIAAAHLELPFQLIDSLMISNVGAGGEGWPMVDKLPHEELCTIARKADHAEHPIPSLIHYCQRYTIGEWFFSKRKMKKDFFECEASLMQEPPSNIVLETDFKHPPGGARTDLDTKMGQREGFMVCSIIGALNDAARFFKTNHCDAGNTNMELNLATLK
jgi:hypothetical protein